MTTDERARLPPGTRFRPTARAPRRCARRELPGRAAVCPAVRIAQLTALALALALLPSVGAASPAPAPASTASAPTPASIEALRAELRRLTAILGDGQGPAPARACVTSYAGYCVAPGAPWKKGTPRPPKTQPRPAPRPEAPALVSVYRAYLERPDAARALDRAAARYHLAQLLLETGETDEGIALLERVTESDPDLERAAWAAALLLDELVVRWTARDNTPARAVATGATLREQLTRLRALPLWRHDAAAPLREREPLLRAGVRWREAMARHEEARVERHPALAARGYLDCAEAFIALFNDFEDHDRADTLLWNAARCYEAGGLVVAAIKTRARLVTAFPESEHVERATLDNAESYLSLTRFEQAAGWYEDYARRYAKRLEARAALERVIWIRSELGSSDALLEAIELYERYYARRDPARAAAVRWRGYATLRDDDARRAYAEAYLKRYARKGGPSRFVVVSAALAKLLWDQTCRARHPEAGLCVDRDRGDYLRFPVADPKHVENHVLKQLLPQRPASAQRTRAIELARVSIVHHERHESSDELYQQDQVYELRAALADAQLLLADAYFEHLVETSARPGRVGDPRARPWAANSSRPITLHERAVIPREARISWVAKLQGPRADALDRLDRAYASIDRDRRMTPASATACIRRGQLREWVIDSMFERPGVCAGPRPRVCSVEKQRYFALRDNAREHYRRCVTETPMLGASPELFDYAADRHLRLRGDLALFQDEIIPDTRWLAEPAPVRAGVITDYETAALLGQTIE